MIELEFLGGAATVTGSKHLVRTSRATVLLECGLFQGHRAEANRRNRSLPVEAGALDAVVLSHAHLDHSGALPVLARQGYRGPIYATPATRDLCAPMLEDAASIQLADARHIDRLIARGVDLDPVTPLYDLLSFAESVRNRQGPGGLRRTFLVHGEAAARSALALQLTTRGFTAVTSPAQGEVFRLTGRQ